MKKTISLVMMVLILMLSVVSAVAQELEHPPYGDLEMSKVGEMHNIKIPGASDLGNFYVYVKLTLSGTKVNSIRFDATGGDEYASYSLYVVPKRQKGNMYIGQYNDLSRKGRNSFFDEDVSITWYYKTKTMSSYKKWTEEVYSNGITSIISVPDEAQYKGAKFYAKLTHKLNVYSTSSGTWSLNGAKPKNNKQITKILTKGKTKTITTTSKSKIYTLPKK